MAEIPGKTSFDLENPFLKDWLDEQSLELSGQVSQTTIDNLSDTLRDGIRAGEGMPDLTKRVQGTFTDASRTRANLIARTEANKAANGASWTQATRSGVVKTKTWISASDSRVRPEHRILHGETVPLDKPFSNGLMFPSEPRCRCTLSYGIDSSKLTGPQEPEVAGVGRPRSPRRYDEHFDSGEFSATAQAAENPEGWGTKEFERWREALTAREKLAVKYYSDEGYGPINTYLRATPEAADPPPILGALDSAIEKGNIPEDVTSHRMFYDPELSGADPFDLVGREITDDGFTSTALKKLSASAPDDLAGPPMLATIRVPKGSKGAYLNGTSEYPEETELLLARGSTFRVSKAYKLPGGSLQLELDLVGQ